MTDLPFDERLSAVLHAYGETAVRPFDADAISTAAMRVRRSPWSRWAAAPTGRRAVLLLLAALLVAVAVGAALTVGNRRDAVPVTPPTPLPRASNSIISVVPTPAAPPAFRGVIATSIDLPSDVFGQPVELRDGRVLLAGGTSSAIVDLDSGAVEQLTDVIFTADPPIALHDGRILIVSYNPMGVTSLVAVFDPSTNQATRLDDNVPVGAPGVRAGCCEIRGAAVALLSDGRVLVAGGHAFAQAPDGPFASAAIFDPANDRFRLLDATMTTPLADATATTLTDGRVLITGGRSKADPGGLASPEATHAQLFDPSTSTFSDLGPVPSIRGSTVAVRLENDQVLVAEAAEGRENDDGLLESHAAVFDPTTDVFIRLPSLPHPLSGAIALRDGRVFLSSEWTTYMQGEGQPLDSPVSSIWAATYDPATGALEDIEDVPSLDFWPLGLSDGRVLLVEDRHPDPTDGVVGPFRVVVYH